MGEIADDIINGKQCSLCGICFVEEHGFPVVCKSCWLELVDEYGDENGIEITKAIFEEL